MHTYDPGPKQPITIDPVARGDYGIVFSFRHRNWRKLNADQKAAILHAGAEQLEILANQMREEAEIIVTAY
jgi:hypothetical protein